MKSLETFVFAFCSETSKESINQSIKQTNKQTNKQTSIRTKQQSNTHANPSTPWLSLSYRSSFPSFTAFFGGNINWHELATSLLRTKIAANARTTRITTA